MKKTIPLAIFFALILMAPSVLQAAPPVETYSELLTAIRGVRAESQARVEKAVEQEKVREAWETGKLIDEHVLQHQERADYGKQVLERLAGDLGISETELGYMLQFARAYPIAPHAGQLSWSEYRELLSVNDAKERQTLAEQAEKEGWNRARLREEVSKQKAAKNEIPVPVQETPLTATPGKPGTYRVIQAFAGPYKGQLALDLGFSNYYRPPGKFRFKDREVVESAKGKLKRSDRTEADIFSYEAYIYKVLDGDTIMAVVDLGFGITTTQTLRLRGIDCPELVSKEGKEAKEFVESVIAPVRRSISGGSEAKQSQPSILIKTVKSDKYDRYLADVFITDRTGKQVYLNNELIEKGHAVHVRE